MKRYILLLLLVAGQAFTPVQGSKADIAVTTGTNKISALTTVQSERQVDKAAVLASSCHRLHQKITGEAVLPVAGRRAFSPGHITVEKTIGSLFAKSYLVHIYPSHHFW